MINKYEINGPINIIRLENKDINKVIYFLGDIHENIDRQFKCNNYESIDIDKLLFKFFKESNNYNDKKWDILFEDNIYNIRNIDIDYQEKRYSNIYINLVNYLIIKNFNYKINDNNNLEVHTNNKFKNIRYHFIDVRFNISIYCDYLYELNSNRKYEWTVNMMKNLDLIEKNIKFNIESLFKKKNNNTSKFIYKILNKYNDNKNKKIINNIVNTVLIPYSKNIIKIIETLKKDVLKEEKNKADYFDKELLYRKKKNCYFSDKNIIKSKYEFEMKIQKLDEYLLHFYSMFMDLYTIRRIIDKKYNTNSILYTGIGHSFNIITILVKYFNFKITNSYYHEENLKNIEEKIKKSKYQINDNYYNCKIFNSLLPKYLTQCTNMKNFPDLFL